MNPEGAFSAGSRSPFALRWYVGHCGHKPNTFPYVFFEGRCDQDTRFVPVVIVHCDPDALHMSKVLGHCDPSANKCKHTMHLVTA